jgi:hypothetical protein
MRQKRCQRIQSFSFKFLEKFSTTGNETLQIFLKIFNARHMKQNSIVHFYLQKTPEMLTPFVY